MTILSVAWIDCTKVYDMVPYTWILQCPIIFKVANNTRNVIEKSVKSWKVELASGAETLGEIKKNRKIE